MPQIELAEKITKLQIILDEASTLVEQIPLESYLKSDNNLQFHIEFIKMGNNKKMWSFTRE